ncbi:MAG: DNA primase [Desulfuromonadales bacterium]|nr:DNA primase [Desulfuromonadales bacterium]
MIPEQKVREVLDRTSIVEVVSEYVQLRRSGANFLGLCPFHSEKTPSFNVNPAREIFHCFGCGTGGNAFSFVMKMEGLSFPEAVKSLARKAGVEIEERLLTPSEKHAQDERQILLRINDIALDYYRTVLKQKPEAATARSYLDRRNAAGAVAEAYGLGFASDRRDDLVKHLKAQGVDLEVASKLGIVRKNEGGWYDLFRNRLIFPIRAPKGDVIAFAGRVLDDSLPKYINSPESPLYHKSSVLFGLDLALPAVRTEKSIVIVEGYFDHLALYRAGILNVAATCGTALTPDHISLLKRHVSKVYSLFDSDAAGRKATIRSMELFLEQRVPTYVISLPEGEDPDSFLENNSLEAFRVCQEKARPAFEFFVRTVLSQIPADSIDSKIRIVDELIPRFRKIIDPLERELYEKEICRLLGISSHAFRKRLGGLSVTVRDLSNSPASHEHIGDTRQETLLALMWRHAEARSEVYSIGVEKLFAGSYLTLASLMLQEIKGDVDAQELSHFLEKAEAPELKVILSRLFVSDGHLADVSWREVFDSCQRGREEKAIRFSNKDIAARLAVLEPGSEEYAALLQQADLLRTRKSKL